MSKKNFKTRFCDFFDEIKILLTNLLMGFNNNFIFIK